ncbi:unnamed protein product [Ilex paraguariensis]|uniref:Transmembrane protein n=1 Tax=Ilex paraguariensis TaxID=185542 RepID=A0ABC8V4C4_9AQUA
MKAMEFKPAIVAFFLIFLIALPCLSRGRLDVSNMDSGIYDIDYTGPKTHSSFPPPKGSGGKPNYNRKSVVAPRKSNDLRGEHAGGNKKKIHG